MGLNLSVGNMFSFITSHWNPIKGCEYGCSYCYMDRLRFKADRSPRLTRRELKTNLYGKGKGVIFVGATGDMWGDWVPAEWIERVLERCRAFPDNVYLFLTKNFGRFNEFLDIFPEKTILGVTVETNRNVDNISDAPSPYFRYIDYFDILESLPSAPQLKFMVCMEPILQFDRNTMIGLLKKMSPHFVVIGANSNGPELPEPTPLELADLIFEFEHDSGFRVVLKNNLRRLLEPSPDDVVYKYADRNSSGWIYHLWDSTQKEKK